MSQSVLSQFKGNKAAFTHRQCNITDYILSVTEDIGSRKALIDSDTGKFVTYQAMAKEVSQISHHLSTNFVKKDRHVVALMLENNIRGALMYLAVPKTKACIMNPLNGTFPSEYIRNNIVNASTNLVIYEDCHLEKLTESLKGLPDSDRPTIISVHDFLAGIKPDESEKKENEKVDSDIFNVSPAIITITNGVTGPAKQIVLSHDNVICNIQQVISMVKRPFEDTAIYLNYWPLSFNYVCVVGFFKELAAGSTIVLQELFYLNDAYMNIEKYKINCLSTIPPVLEVFLGYDTSIHSLKSLKYVSTGASFLSKPLKESFTAKYPDIVLAQGYGLIECSPIISLQSTDDKSLSVGKILDDSEFKIVDIESGDTTKIGVRGELLVKGPQIMLEYLDKKIPSPFTDGWFKTGDYMTCDNEGSLFYVNRVFDLIKVNGNYCAPCDIEKFIMKHIGIADVAAFGVPDSTRGETVCIYIVVNPKFDFNADELYAEIEKNLSTDQYPHAGIHIKDDVMREPSGEIPRRLLREDYLKTKK